MNFSLQRRSQLVYATLIGVWLAVIIWQTFEHLNVRRVNRAALVNRGRDITMTLGLVLRSQRRFGPFTLQERLKPALQELIRPGDLNGLALLSPTGEEVVAAGAPIVGSRGVITGPGIFWDDDSLILMNLVDLGTSEGPENSGNRTTIVLTEDMVPNPFTTNRAGFRSRNESADRRPAGERRTDDPGTRTNRPPGERDREGQTSRRERGSRAPFGRPSWMSDTEYQQLIEKRGVHSFIIALSTDQMRASNRRDGWMRAMILLLATAASGAFASAWRNREQSAEMEIRLVRASEMNAHLKEMNLAAAGLAHETRNPLNLIRGLAQLISRESTAPPGVRDHSRAIMDESDRVTAQLNEFINYSRPRDARPGIVLFQRVASEVARALAVDCDDAGITIRVGESDRQIEADEPLLRQMLFNLMLNAVQAVGREGHIEVVLEVAENPDLGVMEVRDDGPGVPPASRSEIFKPYVTMHQNGTGLGLAIVHQIAAAHGWDVTCLANVPKGAVFRVSKVKLVSIKRLG